MSQDDPGQRDPDSTEPRDPQQHGLEPHGPGLGGLPPPRRDKRLYAALMGTCVVLIIIAWQVVRHFSVLAAIIMSAVALVIPPVAVIIANRASAVDRRLSRGIHTNPPGKSGAHGRDEGLGRASRRDRLVRGGQEA